MFTCEGKFVFQINFITRTSFGTCIISTISRQFWASLDIIFFLSVPMLPLNKDSQKRVVEKHRIPNFLFVLILVASTQLSVIDTFEILNKASALETHSSVKLRFFSCPSCQREFRTGAEASYPPRLLGE